MLKEESPVSVVGKCKFDKIPLISLEVVPEFFNITEIIKENIDLYYDAARQKNISFYHERSDCMVYADKNMINTVLRNLINNAIKFIDKGSIRIISESQVDGVIIKVCDTGIGLSESDREKLFKIEEDTRYIGSPKGKGSGLGLILCKNFIELNNGRIWAESKPGKGSTFCFTIPSESSI